MCINPCKKREIEGNLAESSIDLSEKIAELSIQQRNNSISQKVLSLITDCMSAEDLKKKFKEKELMVTANHLGGKFKHENSQLEIKVAEFILEKLSCNCK